jgi:hypothetical protein
MSFEAALYKDQAIKHFKEAFFGEAYKLEFKPRIGWFGNGEHMITPEQALIEMQNMTPIGIALIKVFAPTPEEIDKRIEEAKKQLGMK